MLEVPKDLQHKLYKLMCDQTEAQIKKVSQTDIYYVGDSLPSTWTVNSVCKTSVVKFVANLVFSYPKNMFDGKGFFAMFVIQDYYEIRTVKLRLQELEKYGFELDMDPSMITWTLIISPMSAISFLHCRSNNEFLASQSNRNHFKYDRNKYLSKSRFKSIVFCHGPNWVAREIGTNRFIAWKCSFQLTYSCNIKILTFNKHIVEIKFC